MNVDKAMTHPSYEFQDNCVWVTLTLKLQFKNGKSMEKTGPAAKCVQE